MSSFHSRRQQNASARFAYTASSLHPFHPCDSPSGAMTDMIYIAIHTWTTVAWQIPGIWFVHWSDV